ncbi:hypothetical protein C2845_PM12G21170 [Panicum miliaceum]|uniref:Tf2-1-like SH3-like domain-containing protein n=1 Tax=Panicum miliaceum TaxID=4540 RepID=A0A3L6QCK5_PANMI|nr:hypothetical protein C2845_PM12G21170 [Panicum miliaceum]
MAGIVQVIWDTVEDELHPQTDGQTEAVLRLIYVALSMLAQLSGSLGFLSLSFGTTLACYRNALQTTTFKALYGHEPNHFGIVAATDVPVPDLANWIQERNLMNDLLKQHLSRSQQRMKNQADKNRSERVFHVGDKVYLKLQPYIQTSVQHHSNDKLSFKFFGPFEIMEKLGTVAYKLKLPPTSAIHPVFHVSQLKQAPGTGHTFPHCKH